jgi:uncharacterized membrane protein
MGNFFSDEASKSIINAISTQERQTYGELRVHVEDLCEGDPLARALEVFEKLKMGETQSKSGVLLYFAVEDKKVAILGDTGIDMIVEPSYWNQIIESIIETIHQSDVPQGIIKGIELVGEKLILHFPEGSGQVNELSNEISYGKI